MNRLDGRDGAPHEVRHDEVRHAERGEVRHVVRVFGHVLDERGAAVAGAVVALWTDPGADGAACMLRGQSASRRDGLYFFLDCPAGEYTATAAGTGGIRGAAAVRIADGPRNGAPIAVADITCRRPPGRATST